jgi:hypothetical protein
MSKLIIIFIIYLVLFTVFKKIARQAKNQRLATPPIPPPDDEYEGEEGFKEAEPADRPAAADTPGNVFEQLFGIQQAQEELKQKSRERKMAAVPKPAPAPPPSLEPAKAAIRPRSTAVTTRRVKKPFYRSLNAAKLKEGIVLSEVIGPCLANREPGTGKYY